MTDEDAFNAVLDANPDDHTVRLAYADYLQDHDDPRAAGMRALGRLERVPFLNWSFGNYASDYDDSPDYSALPNVWFEAMWVTAPEPSRHRTLAEGWISHRTRRAAEDAAALAFAELTPEQQAECPGGAGMTDEDPTLRALHLAVAREPHEDTPRCAYKDWLGEAEAGYVLCPMCKALKSIQAVKASHGYRDTAPDCPRCSGTGEVRDTRYADRLRFVEVGEELAKFSYERQLRHSEYDARDGVSAEWQTAMDQLAEEKSLLRRYDRDWRACGVCEVCRGSGKYIWGGAGRKHEPHCTYCHGTGAACWPLCENQLDYPEDDDTISGKRIQCTWHRGWITHVTTTAANWMRPGVAGTVARWWPLEQVTLTDGIMRLPNTLFIVSELWPTIVDPYMESSLYLTQAEAHAALSRAATLYARREAAKL